MRRGCRGRAACALAMRPRACVGVLAVMLTVSTALLVNGCAQARPAGPARPRVTKVPPAQDASPAVKQPSAAEQPPPEKAATAGAAMASAGAANVPAGSGRQGAAGVGGQGASAGGAFGTGTKGPANSAAAGTEDGSGAAQKAQEETSGAASGAGASTAGADDKEGAGPVPAEQGSPSAGSAAADPDAGGSASARAATGARTIDPTQIPALPASPPPAPLSQPQGIVPLQPEPEAVPVIGRWRQSAGGSTADFLPGGYRDSILAFGEDGVLEVRRSFVGFSQVWHVGYDMVSAGRAIVLGAAESLRPRPDLLHAFTSGTTDRSLTPPSQKFPVTLKIERTDDETLLIADKTYKKVATEK